MRIPGLRLAPEIEALPWLATSAPGVSWLPLRQEDMGSSGRRRAGGTVLIHMDPGSGYAPHRHVGSEDVLVLQGGYRDEQGEYRQGDHVHYSPGSEHTPVALGDPRQPPGTGNPACILYTVVPLGIELLERR